MKKIMLLLLASLVFFTCKDDDDGPVDATLDTEFTISYDQTRTVTSEDLTIHFREIEDNRCPTMITCLTSGEAIVTLDLEKGGQSGELLLSVEGGCFEIQNCTGETKEWLGYNFHLIDVDPHPVDDMIGTTSVYSLRLEVFR